MRPSCQRLVKRHEGLGDPVPPERMDASESIETEGRATSPPPNSNEEQHRHMFAPISAEMLFRESDSRLANSFDASKMETDFKACLFMPYLDLETRVRTLALGKQGHPHSPSAEESAIQKQDWKVQDAETRRDDRLRQVYLDWDGNDFLHHARRTLDQFWYKGIDTHDRDDDQVVGRFQERYTAQKSAIDMLMVDQLWVWVLGPGLILTSFPQEEQQRCDRTPLLLSSVLESLASSRGPQYLNDFDAKGDAILTTIELAVRIVGHCLSASSNTAIQRRIPPVLDMYGTMVEDAVNSEVQFFQNFKSDSASASQWIKSPQSLTAQGEPAFVGRLLDIHHETCLLEEVRDIRNELGILFQLVKDQQTVLRDLKQTFEPDSTPSNHSRQERIETALNEQLKRLSQSASEIESMKATMHEVYQSTTALLDHRQRYAIAIEARFARKQADDTAAAGRTPMVFTIVTVIFLPLSFLAAFFAINIRELPRNADNEQQMSLSFVMRYVVGVGLGIALSFVLLAMYLPGIWSWMRRSLRTRFENPSTIESIGKPHGVTAAVEAPKNASTLPFRMHSRLRSRKGRSPTDEERAIAMGSD